MAPGQFMCQCMRHNRNLSLSSGAIAREHHSSHWEMHTCFFEPHLLDCPTTSRFFTDFNPQQQMIACWPESIYRLAMRQKLLFQMAVNESTCVNVLADMMTLLEPEVFSDIRTPYAGGVQCRDVHRSGHWFFSCKYKSLIHHWICSRNLIIRQSLCIFRMFWARTSCTIGLI